LRDKIEKHAVTGKIEDEALRLVDQPPSIVNDARHERGRNPHIAEQHPFACRFQAPEDRMLLVGCIGLRPRGRSRGGGQHLPARDCHRAGSLGATLTDSSRRCRTDA
jgi:hypothetical protein